MSGLPWLIIELGTGAHDGYYRDEADAYACRDALAEDYPAGQWLVVRVDWARNPPARLPDHMFWMDRLARRTPRGNADAALARVIFSEATA